MASRRPRSRRTTSTERLLGRLPHRRWSPRLAAGSRPPTRTPQTVPKPWADQGGRPHYLPPPRHHKLRPRAPAGPSTASNT